MRRKISINSKQKKNSQNRYHTVFIVLSDNLSNTFQNESICTCNKVNIPIYLTQTPQVKLIAEIIFQNSHDFENNNFFLPIRNDNRPRNEKNINIVSKRMNRDCVSREFSVSKKKKFRINKINTKTNKKT